MPSTALFTDHFCALAGADFAAERLGEEFVRVDVGRDAVRNLLTWEALNDILTTRPLEAPQLRLFRAGEQVPIQQYTNEQTSNARLRYVLRPDDFYRELRHGASLILDSIDRLHPPITEAADDLMELVGELVQANLYLVWGGEQGFTTHWDDHDTLIAQLDGEKHWTIHGPGRPYPMKVDADHQHEPPAGLVWEGVLHPGQIIHVPRGWWHTVRGTGEMSMHLTFGFTRRTGIDWASWVVEQLYEEVLFRRDLPRLAPEERRTAHHDELMRSMIKTVAEHPPDDFLAERDRRFPRRPQISLPWPVRFECPSDSAQLVSTFLRKPTIVAEDESVCVTVSGRTYRFSVAMAAMLNAIVDEKTVSVGRLRKLAELDEERFAAAIELLIRHHLVVIRNGIINSSEG